MCVHACLLAGFDQEKAQLSVGTSSEVSLKVTETDISTLTATIRSPSGIEEPCSLKRLANGHLGKRKVAFISCLFVCAPVYHIRSHQQLSLHFKTTHRTTKMWSYGAGGL